MSRRVSSIKYLTLLTPRSSRFGLNSVALSDPSGGIARKPIDIIPADGDLERLQAHKYHSALEYATSLAQREGVPLIDKTKTAPMERKLSARLKAGQGCT